MNHYEKSIDVFFEALPHISIDNLIKRTASHYNNNVINEDEDPEYITGLIAAEFFKGGDVNVNHIDIEMQPEFVKKIGRDLKRVAYVERLRS
jgi:hypothetical protein